ncbi:MAG TPA: hypothetical protein VF407_06325, partial [Polyangiaceae bacterium]
MGDGDSGESRRKRLEGVIPELIKRAVVAGVERATEAPESIKHFVGDLKLPKELASYIFSQVDETKNGLFRVVAKEMRDFLEHTNIASEMQKMLTSLQFEVSTTIRFKPNGSAANTNAGAAPPADESTADVEEEPKTMPKPEVKTEVVVKRDR